MVEYFRYRKYWGTRAISGAFFEIGIFVKTRLAPGAQRVVTNVNSYQIAGPWKTFTRIDYCARYENWSDTFIQFGGQSWKIIFWFACNFERRRISSSRFHASQFQFHSRYRSAGRSESTYRSAVHHAELKVPVSLLECVTALDELWPTFSPCHSLF